MTTNTRPNLPLPSAIVLNLVNSFPVQRWTFQSDQVVRIGRATDNNVVLFSVVVSRHHAELRWIESTGWQLSNMSNNGIYLNGEPIKTITVADNMVIRLATSGPKIHINLLPQQ